MGVDLELAHETVPPAIRPLTLVTRRDYGAEVQAPTAILRFALSKVPLWKRLAGRGIVRRDCLIILPRSGFILRYGQSYPPG